MTQEQVAGNKLIAEFCGAFVANQYTGLQIPADTMQMVDNTFPDLMYTCRVDKLRYHTSWDWLMPVVEKIESIHDEHHGYFQVHISSNSCSIQGTNLWKAIGNPTEYGAVYMSDPNAILDTKIQSTWYNIIQFITWYNTTNQKQSTNK